MFPHLELFALTVSWVFFLFFLCQIMAAVASPVSPRFVMLKWVYIIRDKDQNDVTTRCFDVSTVYDAEYLNDYPSNLKLSDNDAKKFGFLIKLGYQLYFKCISSLMFNEHKKPY